MLSHPILNALFDEKALQPSKQLGLVRKLLKKSVLSEPTILILLPPFEDFNLVQDAELFYHDYFLLSHVLAVSDYKHTDVLTCLNGSGWQVELSNLMIYPRKGFPDTGSHEVGIINAYLWSPGLSYLEHDSSFFIIETDSPIISKAATKNLSWFGQRRSTPVPGCSPGLPSLRSFALPKYSMPSDLAYQRRLKFTTSNAIHEVQSNFKASKPGKLRNPASDLGKSKSARDQNMAKVDYCLACLQNDAISSTELAERFHRAVTSVRSALIEAGGLYVESTEQDTAGENSLEELSIPYCETHHQNLGSSFTLASIYQYAEARLSSHLRRHLAHFLELERKGQPSFFDVYKQLRNLDLGQMDIPNIDQLDVAAFERAVYDASLILGRLQNARDSCEMCNVFLVALTRLANRSLGMVSADTLLGLLMLTVLRVSEDTAERLELDLHFVSNFSFQASDTIQMRASAGRVSYTLMVFQSVLMQLRKELTRLSAVAEANKDMWHAVRGDVRVQIEKVYQEYPSSLLSRRSGKSALVMAAEDRNHSLLKWLLEHFSESFTPKFVMKDRDLKNRTLLMITVADDRTSKVILEALKTVEPEELKDFFNSRDLDGRTLAHYLNISKLSAKYASQLDWSLKDKHGLTPLTSQARVSIENLSFFIDYRGDFHDHIDPEGSSLLHVAVANDHLSLAENILQHPTCDVNWRNAEMQTPLMTSKSAEMSSLLLRYDADPWAGQIDAEMFPSLRASRLANRENLPYVTYGQKNRLVIFKHAIDTRRLEKRCSDFAELSSALHLLSPHSWVPTITFSDSNSIQPGTFAYLFRDELLEVEMQRLSYWLRLLKKHPTFGDAKEFSNFFGVSSETAEHREIIRSSEKTEEESPNEKATTASLFGKEDEASILAFLKLGSERLTEINEGIQEMSRKFSAMSRIQKEDFNASAKIGQLVNCLAQSHRLESKMTGFSRQLDLSTGCRNFASTLDQTAFFAYDLRVRLDSALELAHELDTWRSHLRQDWEKMRALANGTLRVSWIGNVEEKRINEIGSLERAISRSRKEIETLELDLKASHFYLANELSSFNKTQEEEILSQVKSHSKLQLTKSKEILKRLLYIHSKR